MRNDLILVSTYQYTLLVHLFGPLVPDDPFVPGGAVQWLVQVCSSFHWAPVFIMNTRPGEILSPGSTQVEERGKPSKPEPKKNANRSILNPNLVPEF